MKYDFANVIMRGEPLHEGHVRMIKFAKQQAARVNILVGSSFQHRSPKNPFTFSERRAMLIGAEMMAPDCLNVVPIKDMPYNDTAWLTQVRDTVAKITPTGSSMALVGYKKPGDATAYYQDLFPEWDYVSAKQFSTINATDVRNQYFQDSPMVSEFLPPNVRKFMKEFIYTETFKWLLDEQKFLIEYHKKWGKGPFITTDNVVTQSGHILLVTRKEPPYRGALALPGGFLNPGEYILDGAIRELKEETRIEDGRGEIPPAKLRSFITASEVFDDPNRSARGRIVTHAFRYKLPDGKGLWRVRGDDDAEKAQWYPISKLRSEDFMEDHGAIIQKMVGVQLA